MTKSEKEMLLTGARKEHQSQIDQIDKKLKALQGMRDINIKDLFLAYEMREGFEVVKESGPYKYHILDWFDVRTGLVLKVTTPKDLYMSEDDLRSFNIYLKMTEGSDVQAIFINGEQQL